MKLTKTLLLILILPILALKCNDDKDTAPDDVITPVVQPTQLQIMFEHVIDGVALELNSKKYLNANSDTFNISKFKYILSNIKLFRNDSLIYSEPESYHIIKSTEGNMSSLFLNNVTINSYDKIEFSIGVDSVRNHTGDQTGALSPDNDMYWAWSTGYIFLKFEGEYFNNSTNPLSFHVGNDVNYKTYSFSHPISVVNEKTTLAHFMVNVGELFKNPTTVDFTSTSTSPSVIANNYTNMFMLHHVENP